jgi:dipeptidyl aminopeptidase/acylaminoacyl peptidase
MKRVAVLIAFLLLQLLLTTCSAQQATSCPPGALVILEHGKLAGAAWEERTAMRVHTHVVLMQSMVVDSTMDLRPDQTASRASTVLLMAGDKPMEPKLRSLGEGAIYWSDMNITSVEQAVLRARALGGETEQIQGASLFSDARNDITVHRLDPTDWSVEARNKKYLVLTDENGCVLAATLPEYGVVIERRADFKQDQYPLWAPYDAPPDHAYSATEVSIPAPQGYILAGTLTIPPHHGNVPAVVLITGLSPSERNGGSPPWMPLRDIADALTRAGIAVLRVDDRGIGKSTGDHKPSTTFDEAEDVQTEVGWLRHQKAIDPKRIALVGYSEGGLIAPMVASKDTGIAAIVTLDGPGTSGADLARYQIENAVMRDDKVPAADKEKEIQKQLAEELTPREKSVLSIDPMDYASKVRVPALVIQGGNDLHVPLRSAERIATAMRSHGNSDVTVRVFPGISHSLLPDPIGLNSGWVYLPAFETSPELLDVTSTWLKSRLVKR